MGWWSNHWVHVVAGGWILWFLGCTRRRIVARRLERANRDWHTRLKWEQQRERFRVKRWRDEIGKLD